MKTVYIIEGEEILRNLLSTFFATAFPGLDVLGMTGDGGEGVEKAIRAVEEGELFFSPEIDDEVARINAKSPKRSRPAFGEHSIWALLGLHPKKQIGTFSTTYCSSK